MAIFRQQTPEEALTALRVRADKLEGRRAAAQVSLDEAKAKRQQHLVEGDIDGDDKLIARLEADVSAAASRLSGLVDALAALGAQISDAEYQLQVERDQAARKEAAERLTAQVVRFEELLTPMLVAMRGFIDGCVPLEPLSFEVSQLHGFVLKTIGEIEVCAGFVAPDLKLQIEMIRNGQRIVPKPAAEIIELTPVEPLASATSQGEATETVFALAPLRWRDKGGNRHFAERWSDAELPVRLKARASPRQVIAGLDDPRRRDHRGLLGSFAPPEGAICDLDAELLSPPSDLPAGFERLPTGPERKIAFPVERT
jgi:hypothetical protein